MRVPLILTYLLVVWLYSCFGYVHATAGVALDACTNLNISCHPQSLCVNSSGSLSCKCVSGFEGNGTICQDIDECSTSAGICNITGTECFNEPGSFVCACKLGFKESGTFCENIDECLEGMDSCHPDAKCIDTPGSFNCTCNSGFVGNGVTCKKEREMSTAGFAVVIVVGIFGALSLLIACIVLCLVVWRCCRDIFTRNFS